jgi:hypothetical protein
MARSGRGCRRWGAGLSTVSAIHAPSCAATSDKLKRVSVTPQCGWLRRRCGLELPEGWAEQTAGYDQGYGL